MLRKLVARITGRTERELRQDCVDWKQEYERVCDERHTYYERAVRAEKLLAQWLKATEKEFVPDERVELLEETRAVVEGS